MTRGRDRDFFGNHPEENQNNHGQDRNAQERREVDSRQFSTTNRRRDFDATEMGNEVLFIFGIDAHEKSRQERRNRMTNDQAINRDHRQQYENRKNDRLRSQEERNQRKRARRSRDSYDDYEQDE